VDASCADAPLRKLYGRIKHNLHAGQIINVSIANVYNTYSFNGSKSLVLTTTSFLGGKNPFLGRAYLTMGVLGMLMALVSILVQLQHPRKFWRSLAPYVESATSRVLHLLILHGNKHSCKFAD
jgi:hypothetical protein